MTRQTHTYVTLEISRAAWQEIRDLLAAADYGHCFNDGDEIDMTGIAVVPEPDPPGGQREERG